LQTLADHILSAPNAPVPFVPGPDTRTYFVTDGGATENLGLVSALVVLKNTLYSMGVKVGRNCVL
jgi:hypothetical protein